MNSFLVIYTPQDDVVYEADWIKPQAYTNKLDSDPHLPRFLLYAALDALEVARWRIPSTFLGVIDVYGEWMVTAFLSLSDERFLLLHDVRGDEATLKAFLNEVHEAWIKTVQQNPFYLRGYDRKRDELGGTSPLIDSLLSMDLKGKLPKTMNAFDLRVRVLAKNYNIN
jgi:trafficking protein particle complex subunit 2